MMKTIVLKQSYDDMGPTEIPKEHYPSFTYSGPEELDLPEEGEMTIRFKKTDESSSTRDGKTRHTCTIEVREITDVSGEDSPEAPAKSRDKETGDALDKLAAAKMKSKKSDKEDEEDY